MLVFTQKRFIFRVIRQETQGGRTNHVDSQVILLRMLEGCLGKLCCNTAAAKSGWNLGMPDGHPTGSVDFKFDVRGLAVLVNFESALRNLGRSVVHTKEMRSRIAGIHLVTTGCVVLPGTDRGFSEAKPQGKLE